VSGSSGKDYAFHTLPRPSNSSRSSRDKRRFSPVNPGRVGEVPCNGLAQSTLKLLAVSTLTLVRFLRRRSRSAIVSGRSLTNVINSFAVLMQPEAHLVHEVADGRHHIDIGSLAVAPDVVVSPMRPCRGRSGSRRNDLQQTASRHVHPIAVDRQRLPFECFKSREDELLRKLKGAVIVGTVVVRTGKPRYGSRNGQDGRRPL